MKRPKNHPDRVAFRKQVGENFIRRRNKAIDKEREAEAKALRREAARKTVG